MSSPSIPLQRGRKIVVSPFFARILLEVEFCFPLPKGEEIVVIALHHDIRRSRFLFPPSEGGLRGMTV